MQSNATYLVSTTYKQSIEGFANVGDYRLGPPFRVPLVNNVTAQVPIYMSNPRFWLANATYTSKVSISKPATFDDCATTVDIEPYTGNGACRAGGGLGRGGGGAGRG